MAPPPPRLVTLGGLTLVSSPPHESVTQLGPGKPVALLLYLHSAPNRCASREHLTDLLWADLDPIAARHALRQTLWYLRQRLGPESIRTDNGDITLTVTLHCDRDAFIDAVTAGRFEDAVAIYRGHFLPGFAVPGGLEFEHWADAERTRLRLMFLRAAESVVRARLSIGHAREARHLAHRVRDGNTQSEAAWRLYLETLVAAHDAVGALAEAERMLTVFRQEGRTPEPATRALLRAIQREPEPAAAPTTGLVADLVGREREFAGVIEAWETARGGRAMHLHVSAPAGLGKTRLLLDVEARLAAASGRCIYARANPGERAVPFALAAELAARLTSLGGAKGIAPASAGALVALNPALSSTYSQPADTAVGDEAARRRTLAVADLVRTLADEAPLALLVDDLHWADLASRQLLDSALGRLDNDRVLVVTAARPVPGSEPPRQATRVELPPLTLEQVTALLASLGSLPDGVSVDLPRLLLDASDGSPLHALESLQAALDVGLLHLADGAWSCPNPTALAERLTHGSAVRDRVAHLERHQGWLLTLLATVGLPIPADALAAAAGREGASVADDLLDLERRGFAQRTLDGWEPAHDAIGEASTASAAPDARRAAAAALGRVLVGGPEPPPHVLARAAQLLAMSDEAALGDVFRRWVRGRRRAGDRRRPATLATDLLGLSDAKLTLRLARSLPLADQLGFTPGTLGVAAGALLVVGAFALGNVMRSRPEPDAQLLIAGTAANGKPAAYSVSLFENRWDPSEPIEAGHGTAQPRLADAGGWYSGGGTFDGVTWARSVPSDTGSVDVVVRRRDGTEQWLTSGPADDNFEDWSPDGRYVAFTTGRWHARSMYDVATVEVATGTIRQLTRGDANDVTARWSPDGSRIGFVRRHTLTGGRDEICWVAVDGTGEQCRAFEPPVFYALEWLSPTEILAGFAAQGEQGVLRIDLATGSARTLDVHGTEIGLSPDGRWATCRCLPAGAQRLGWYVLPIERPEQLRLVTWDGSPDVTMRVLWATARPPTYMEGLFVDSLPAGVAVGTRIRPTVTGRDPDGRVTRTPLLNWSVSDTALATVRADGSILARAVGTVVLTASAGGWRTASAAVRIHADTARTVLRETWTGDLESEWRSYGVPRPIVVTGASGSGLLVNGDASHFSGLYSLRALAPDEGFGLDVRLRTPITSSQWQHLNVVLAAPNPARLAAWDHISGAAPEVDIPTSTCSVNASTMGIEEGILHVGLSAAGTQRQVPLPWPPAEERWYTVRIQVMPDGRCGFALDGRPVWVSKAHLTMDRPFRIVLTGQTVESRLLVGALEAWQGVRMDVDWETIDRESE